MKVRFCASCGRLVLADFLYCPYCGTASSRGPDLTEALKEPFERMEEARQPSVEEELLILAERLDALESDMEVFLAARKPEV